MDKTWNTKVGDTAKTLRCALFPLDRNLTGASVFLNMRAADGSLWINRGPATLVQPIPPIVEYKFLSEQLVPGEYTADFTAVYSNGDEETFDERDAVEITIKPRGSK